MAGKKKLLLFAFEYNGYHSAHGTALSKRAKQIAESFSASNWEVTVIHKDQVKECGDQPFISVQEKENIRRISVKGPLESHKTQPVILRKLLTLLYITFRGDRSYLWAVEVIKNFPQFNITVPFDHIISCYEPRAPLYLGHYFSKKMNVPWIADLQDPIYDGITKSSVRFSQLWARKILKSAKEVVHVSPEWADIDGRNLGIDMKVIRHAIPAKNTVNATIKTPDLIRANENSFNVFYGGFLSTEIQSLNVLREIIEFAASVNLKIKIFVAGKEMTYNIFTQALGPMNVVQLGWLNVAEMNEYIYNCHCTMVIPCSQKILCIPSKFYELCSYPKPIWIIGNDLGAFPTLLKEWKHPTILSGDIEFQKTALMLAVKNDFSHFFNFKNCKVRAISAQDLYNEYLKLM